jgi:hypothetical protein
MKKKTMLALAFAGLTALLYGQTASDFYVLFNVLFRYNGTATDVVIPANLGITEIGERAFANTKITSVAIPAGITAIGDKAFAGCSLTSITIPASVAVIGNYVFVNCGKLTSITVDKNNNAYTDVEGVLFNKTKTLLIKYPEGKQEESYVVTKGVEQIGNYSFTGCNSLTSIIIPTGVTIIGNGAFSFCSSLTNIIIPTGVAIIKDFAFAYCKSLTSIILPDGLITIGSAVFFDCRNLTDISIPASVKEVGDCAFAECDAFLPETRAAIKKRFGEDVFNWQLLFLF